MGLQVRWCYDAPSTIKALIDVLCRSRSETFLTSKKEQEGAANVTLKSDTDVWGPLAGLSGGSWGSRDADHRHQHKSSHTGGMMSLCFFHFQRSI